MHAYRADLPRGLCETLTMHDPLYDEIAPGERWVLGVLAVLAICGIGAYIYRGLAAPPESPQPAPATERGIPETVTEIPAGRLVCERWERGGCRVWRIYRTIEH